MIKRLLFIDDRDIQDEIDLLILKAKQQKKLEFECELYNPLLAIDNSEDYDEGLEKIFDILKDKVTSKRIDLVACDFMYGDEYKSLAFSMTDFIRQNNQSCAILLYSGLIQDAVKYILEGESKKEVEKPLRSIISSRIMGFVKRSNRDETILRCICHPSIELVVETNLLEYSEMKFSHGFEPFQGETLGEIAKEIRTQSENGKKFTEAIIERTIAHMIDLNNTENE